MNNIFNAFFFLVIKEAELYKLFLHFQWKCKY